MPEITRCDRHNATLIESRTRYAAMRDGVLLSVHDDFMAAWRVASTGEGDWNVAVLRDDPIGGLVETIVPDASELPTVDIFVPLRRVTGIVGDR